MEDYDRQARPWIYPCLKKAERPAARRAKKSTSMIRTPASPLLRVAA
jgi:hypothetical protein